MVARQYELHNNRREGAIWDRQFYQSSISKFLWQNMGIIITLVSWFCWGSYPVMCKGTCVWVSYVMSGSAICKKVATHIAFWVDWLVGPKLTVFVWKSDATEFPKKINSEQFMNSRVKIIGKRLYWPNLRDAAVLENVQLRFNFPCICL